MIHELPKDDIQKNFLADGWIFIFYPFNIQEGDEIKIKMSSGKFAAYKIDKIKPVIDAGTNRQSKVKNKEVYNIKLGDFRYL